jgi:hypothetical protein
MLALRLGDGDAIGRPADADGTEPQPLTAEVVERIRARVASRLRR